MKIELVDLCELIVGAGISGPANAQSIDELTFLNNQYR